MEGHVLDGTVKDVNKKNYRTYSVAIKGEVSISHVTCIRYGFTTDLFLALKKEPTFCEAIVVVCF